MAMNLGQSGILKSINGYDVHKKLGQGGFGTCFLVSKNGSYYAMKEITTVPSETQQVFQEAEKEISILECLSHNNIVSYVGAFLDGRSVYLVMEYCDGAVRFVGSSCFTNLQFELLEDSKRTSNPAQEGLQYLEPIVHSLYVLTGHDPVFTTLKELTVNRIKHRPILITKYFSRKTQFWRRWLSGDLNAKINENPSTLFPIDTIMNWFIQLCNALRYVHSRNIIHRDVKPQNIFLTSSGVVKLGDFGIAKILERFYATTMCGTYAYIAPEVQSGHYTSKIDVWSAGCVLYELTTKRMWNPKMSLDAQPIPSKYPLELKNVLNCMLQYDPKKRAEIKDILNHSFVKSFGQAQ